MAPAKTSGNRCAHFCPGRDHLTSCVPVELHTQAPKYFALGRTPAITEDGGQRFFGCAVGKQIARSCSVFHEAGESAGFLFITILLAIRLLEVRLEMAAEGRPAISFARCIGCAGIGGHFCRRADRERRFRAFACGEEGAIFKHPALAPLVAALLRLPYTNAVMRKKLVHPVRQIIPQFPHTASAAYETPLYYAPPMFPHRQGSLSEQRN